MWNIPKVANVFIVCAVGVLGGIYVWKPLIDAEAKKEKLKREAALSESAISNPQRTSGTSP